MALKAIESLNKSDFTELKSFRAPPQRVLAVMNTLCLMFRQPPGWDSGKQLLIRENFYEDLMYYDKKNVPDDIYNALSQICSVPTFRPEFVRPGSAAAASFCEWILAIYEFSRFERTYGARLKELRRQEEAYNKRLKVLGEKRIRYCYLLIIRCGKCKTFIRKFLRIVYCYRNNRRSLRFFLNS